MKSYDVLSGSNICQIQIGLSVPARRLWGHLPGDCMLSITEGQAARIQLEPLLTLQTVHEDQL